MNGALLLILSLLAAPPTADGPSSASATQALYHCDFADSADSDVDGWPDGWTRKRSRDFPEFVEIEITPLPEFAKRPGVMGLQVGLSGGASSVSTAAIPITAKHSLEASVEITAQNVVRSNATMILSLLDAAGNVVESYSSAPFTGPQKQALLTIGPIIPTSGRARSAILTLQVTVPGPQLDLKGNLWFSELRLCKLPRMTLRTNSELGLITNLSDATVHCQVSGLSTEQSELLFELLDYRGERLAQSRHSLSTVGPGSPAWQAFSLNTATVNNAAAAEAQVRTNQQEGDRSASWKLPLKQQGFYRVRATMFAGEVALLSREMTLATLSPLTKSQVGEFGWSIPAGQTSLDFTPLALVLSQAGIHHAKYPVWFGDAESDLADRVAWFAERLSLQNIEMVGVLDRPPVTANGNALTDAASIFSSANDWQTAVDPVMTRLSLKVRRWQLGADDDMSFVGYPDLETKIAEVKNHLERFGQEVRLGIPWRYSHELPVFQKPTCGYLAFVDDPGLTAAEIGEFLSATNSKATPTPPALTRSLSGRKPVEAKPAGDGKEGRRTTAASFATGEAAAAPRQTQRWVSVDPLPANDYALEVRLADLVARLVSAKTHGAEAIFATKPFDPQQGLVNADGTPGELFLPWRTVATLLSDAKYVGQIELPNGSTNHVFAREKEAVMVIWNENETEEVLQLGDELTSVDMWGRQTLLTASEETPEEPMGHRVKIGRMPQIITGIDAAMARWQIGVHFESPRLESIFDREQTITLKFNNPFPRGISGEVSIAAKKSWNIDARPQRYKLLPGDTASQKIPVRLQPDASSGSQRVRIDFHVTESRSYRFSVYRVLYLGFEDIQIELSTRLLPGDILRVDQTFTNLSDTPTSFQCLLFPPDRRRETQLVSNLSRESRTITYFLPNGEELIGKRLLMRAEELGGARVMNFGVVAER